MKVMGMLSGPPPCGVCRSKEHGHLRIGEHSIACPLSVEIPESLRAKVTLQKDGLHVEIDAVNGGDKP